MKKYVVLLLTASLLTGCIGGGKGTNEEGKDNGEVEIMLKEDVTISLEDATSAVQEYGLMEWDELISVDVDGSEIKAIVELDFNKYTLVTDGEITKDEALAAAYTSIADKLFEEQNWSVLTVEFKEQGTVSMKWMDHIENDYGIKYYDVSEVEKSIKN